MLALLGCFLAGVATGALGLGVWLLWQAGAVHRALTDGH